MDNEINSWSGTNINRQYSCWPSGNFQYVYWPNYPTWPSWQGTSYRTVGQEIIEAYKAGIISCDEARKALKLSYPYTFADVETLDPNVNLNP
jgi:hypothetical protein